jgi:hypothetical protein
LADRGVLPDWTDRVSRNAAMTAAYRADVEAAMPAWEPPAPTPPRRSLFFRLLGRA